MKIFLHRVVGPLACNCYVVGEEATRRAIVIDPGGEADELAAEIVSQGLTITARGSREVCVSPSRPRLEFLRSRRADPA